MNVKDKAEAIYEQLIVLQKSDNKDRLFAFECVGYLGNESINDSFEKRLDLIEYKISKYKLNKKSS